MLNTSKIIRLMACILLCASSVKAQTDTEFWFVAPEVSKTEPYILDSPIVFRVTAYGSPANITITQPAGGGFPATGYSVAANSTITIPLSNFINSIENRPADVVLNRGFKIESTSPVTIYYEIVTGAGSTAPRQDNPEIFVLKGKNALGTDFWIPSQNLLSNDNVRFNPQPFSAFDIVASEDNTQVTINPAKNIVGHLAGTPFTITLNKGQTYSATAASQLAAQHLAGSRVIATKPIAITVKDDLLTGSPYGSCGDIGGDQIIPTDLLGTEYIAMNGQLFGPGDYVFLTATQNATQIFKDGVLQTTINAGQTYQMNVVNAATYIQSSSPVTAWQLSGIGCEIGLTQLPQIHCTGSNSVSYTRSTAESLWINVFVPVGFQGNFQVNGSTTVLTAANFLPVPGTTQWVAARIQLPLATYPKGSVIRVTNTQAKFHLGVLDGGSGSGASFGYFSNYGGFTVTPTATPNPACIGDNIQLQSTAVSGATYSWIGPNGFSSNLQNPVVGSAGFLNSGTYTVTATSTGCVGSGSVNVSVIKCPKECIIEVGYFVNLNNPYTYNFYASTNPSTGTFVWNFGDGSGNYTTGSNNISHTFPGPGSYTVSVVFTTPSGQVCSKVFTICVSRGDVPAKAESRTGMIENDEAGSIGELYPNPANTVINIPVKDNNPDARYSIVLYNVEGKTVQKYENLQSKAGILSVNIKNLVQGMYLAEIHTPDAKVNRKFVKL